MTTDLEALEARVAALINENLMLRSKLAKHGLMPPARKPLRLSALTPLRATNSPDRVSSSPYERPGE